jgi:formylmethanofuran dehydrogenase subunit C
MKPLVLALKKRPDQRLDMSELTPDRLAEKSAAEIARIELQTTRSRVTVGDMFRMRAGDPRSIRIEGECDRLDRIGEAMGSGEIVVEGNAGIQAGRLMRGGRLLINGSVGPWAASRMRGGLIEIAGSAGERLGGPLPGEISGMRGGVVIVRRDVGDRAGDRMRRGTILVEGGAGAYAGSRMIAGTIIIRRKAGVLPGYLMRRGTLVLADGCEQMAATFVDCGVHDLVALRLLRAFVGPYSSRLARVFRDPLRRLIGDMAVLGKGETFLAGVR